MELLQVEHALRRAVDERRNFDHCAEWLGAIVGKLSISSEERTRLLDELAELFDTYPTGRPTSNE